MVVTTPEGDVILYPCYRWIGRGEIVELRGGRGLHQCPQITDSYILTSVLHLVGFVHLNLTAIMFFSCPSNESFWGGSPPVDWPQEEWADAQKELVRVSFHVSSRAAVCRQSLSVEMSLCFWVTLFVLLDGRLWLKEYPTSAISMTCLSSQLKSASPIPEQLTSVTQKLWRGSIYLNICVYINYNTALFSRLLNIEGKGKLQFISVCCLFLCSNCSLFYFSGIELKVKGLLGSTAQWESIEDIKKIFWYKKTTMSGMFFLSHLLVVSVTHPIYVMVS